MPLSIGTRCLAGMSRAKQCSIFFFSGLGHQEVHCTPIGGVYVLTQGRITLKWGRWGLLCHRNACTHAHAHTHALLLAVSKENFGISDFFPVLETKHNVSVFLLMSYSKRLTIFFELESLTQALGFLFALTRYRSVPQLHQQASVVSPVAEFYQQWV